MRPDEHKKKRSAQYQRKHGGGGGAKGEKKDNDKSGAKSGKQGSSKSAKTVSCTPRPLPSQNKTVGSASGSDSEDEEHAAQQKSFRRREIASNWAKYDIPPAEADESSTIPKGQDFNKLLQGSGSAIAHFRFKDEECWEGDTEGDAAPSALFLDCSRLADNLDCLPLYTQLRLDTDIFSPEQVATMDKAADQHRALKGLPALNQQNDERPSSSSAVETKSSAENQYSETQSKGFSDADLDCLLESSEADSSEGGMAGLEKGVHGLNISAVDRNISQIKATQDKARAEIAASKTGKGSQHSSVGFSDADLDNLLDSGGADVKYDGEDVTSSGKAVPEISKGATELDLDDLSKDTPQVNSMPCVSIDTSQEKKVSDAAAESAELEDWLDSMLDG